MKHCEGRKVKLFRGVFPLLFAEPVYIFFLLLLLFPISPCLLLRVVLLLMVCNGVEFAHMRSFFPLYCVPLCLCTHI